MARVQRHAIKANIGTKTVRLDKPLRGVVAVLAERLERAEPEFVGVAVMWLDVIADCRRLGDAAFEAERAGDVHLAGAFGFEPSEPEYHLPNFVGWPQTPRARPTIRRPVAGAGAQPHQSIIGHWPPQTTNLGVRSSNLFGRANQISHLRGMDVSWRIAKGQPRDIADNCIGYGNN